MSLANVLPPAIIFGALAGMLTITDGLVRWWVVLSIFCATGACWFFRQVGRQDQS